MSAPRGDLPPGISAALVLLAVILVFVLSSNAPALPEGLPPLSYDPRGVRDSPREGPLPPAWREAMAAWEALVSAQSELAGLSRSDAHRAAALRTSSERALGRFSEIVQLATGRGLEGPRTALRAEARRSFLRDTSRGDPRWGAITARHGLSGASSSVYATRAVRIAWFDFRWERFSTPTPEHGDLGGLAATLERIPEAEQRALVSWGLAARCPELLGARDYPRPGDPTRCSALRRELIDMAVALDRGYPESEARAAMDVLRAEGIHTLMARSSEEHDLGAMRAEAEHALLQARGRYGEMLGAEATGLNRRRVLRYYKGVVAMLTH